MPTPEFASIYEEHKEKVWRIVSRYVFSREDREDLFQEVFLAVHRALPGFRGESKIETWLFRLATNTSINYVNKQSRIRRLKELLSGLRLIEVAEPAEPGDLSGPLKKLNPRQRLVLVMAEVEEFTLEEIAAQTGLPVGTVKSNLHRAKEIVKKEVVDNGEVYGLYWRVEKGDSPA
ncbi:MAG TPA: sigma-70 family RNA polymerase sigma factor [Candidatus Sulfotelmatobacter sp.]|nr:sigma-70 family RNA polymerase sigma factor [Candidatus Sulfotelmatobacter sp.]